MESKNTWNIYNASQLKEAERFAAEYRHFLDGGKAAGAPVTQIGRAHV